MDIIDRIEGVTNGFFCIPMADYFQQICLLVIETDLPTALHPVTHGSHITR